MTKSPKYCVSPEGIQAFRILGVGADLEADEALVAIPRYDCQPIVGK